MKKNTPFKFNAIETVYNQYRFRSRLEARHAVFFDALGIKYEYEKEGYDLGGTWYLPDFWLPGEDRWVEIKGQAPTEEEINKARTLSTCTQKHVSILYGEIGCPDPNTRERSSFSLYPACLWTYPKTQYLGGASTESVSVPTYILMLLQELKSNYITLSLDDTGCIILSAEETSDYTVYGISELISILQNQRDILHKAQDILKEKEEEIQKCLTPRDGWVVEFLEQDIETGIYDESVWGECDACHTFHLVSPYGATHQCSDTASSGFSFSTPRLIEAYAAARQARFEKGK